MGGTGTSVGEARKHEPGGRAAPYRLNKTQLVTQSEAHEIEQQESFTDLVRQMALNHAQQPLD